MDGDGVTQGKRRKVLPTMRFYGSDVAAAMEAVARAEVATAAARLAYMAAPPGTPQSPPARLGKDKESWDVLLVEERAAAEKLGWTPESWEHGDPPVCSSAWETLDAEQRAAATALGYERVIWDEEAAASDLELLELLGAFPLLELPEEMQLLVAAHVVSSPRDRAALCVAVPPLGRKAIKEIPTYTGPLMSLGKRVLSGGAVGEAEVRRYVREFAPSETVHPSLAFNECAQLNAIGARSARVWCYVTEASNLEWQLERGRGLLRSWKISLTGVTLHISPGNRNGTPVQPFAWPALKSFPESDNIAKRVTFQVKSATPTGREMGAANLEDCTSIAAVLLSDGRAMVTHLVRHGNAPLRLW